MNKRFQTIILKCQELRKKYWWDYEDKCEKQIKKYSREIIEKDLVNQCTDPTFAKQLCMVNNLEYKNTEQK